MEISISEEQDHLLKLVEKNAIPELLDSGNFFPTIFVHTGEDIKYFQFQPSSDLDALRETAIKLAREKCEEILAYVLAYDSSIEIDGESIDALILESGDEEDAKAIEFAVPYDREEGRSDKMRPVAKLDNPIYSE